MTTVADGRLDGLLLGDREAEGTQPGAGPRGHGPTIRFRRPVPVLAAVTVAGPFEDEGPLHGRFDRKLRDHLAGQRTWEMAEAKFQEMAVDMAIEAAGLRRSDIDAMLGGDLLNQLGAASFAARAIDLPMLGLYGACSTCGQGLLLGAALCDAGYFRRVVVVVSSHHHAAERQFRFPTEFGNQRPPTAQWTATGAAAFVLGWPEAGAGSGGDDAGDGRDGERGRGGPDSRGDDGGGRATRDAHANGQGGRGERGTSGDDGGGRAARDAHANGQGGRRDLGPGTNGHRHPGESGVDAGADGHGTPASTASADRRPRIVAGTTGRVVDMGLKDPFDMGGAEAPAAADTILRHLRGRDKGPEHFDAIATGDLARYGRPVAEELLGDRGVEVNLRDCGERLYDPRRQDVHAGGSGAACCALVLAADLMPKVRAGEWQRLLFVATGALLSPTSYQQGESIPCIAHAVEIVAPGADS